MRRDAARPTRLLVAFSLLIMALAIVVACTTGSGTDVVTDNAPPASARASTAESNAIDASSSSVPTTATTDPPTLTDPAPHSDDGAPVTPFAGRLDGVGPNVVAAAGPTTAGTGSPINITETLIGPPVAFWVLEPTLLPGGLTFDMPDADTTLTHTVDAPPGSYVFSQQPLVGWRQSPFSGDCGPTGAITVVANATYNCAITTSRAAGVKFDVTAVGGDDTFAFATNPGGASVDVTTVGGANASTINDTDGFTLDPGSYSFTATPPPGWTITDPLGGPGCAGGRVTLASIEDVTCSITFTKDPAPVPARVRIHTTTVPAGSQPFTFNASIPTVPPQTPTFTVTDGQTSQEFDVPTGGTPSSFTETVPKGWAFTGVTGAGCQAAPGESTFSISGVQPGATVDCFVTNTKLASVTINTTTVGGDATFDFTEPALGPRSVTTKGGSGFATYQDVPSGTYHLNETALSGWAHGTFGGDCAADGTVTIAAGKAATCSITNNKLAAMTIDTVTAPAGTTRSFAFTTTGALTPPTFSIRDADPVQTFSGLAPGQTYTFTEQVPTGWRLSVSGAGCTLTAASNTVSVTPAAGQAVDCVLTNTQLASISIDKVTAPVGDTTSFLFTTGGGLSPATFSLTDGSAPQVFNDVVPGQTYTVSETVPTNWTLLATGNGCEQKGNVVTVTPQAGQAVGCTFTNTKNATIRLDKTTLPAGSTEVFNFTTTGGLNPSTFTMTDATPVREFVVAPNGTYTITESALPSGWHLLPVSGCGTFDATTRTVTIVPSAGQILNCSFVNSARILDSITIDKVTVPGGDPTNFAMVFQPPLFGQPISFQLADATPPRTFTGVLEALPYEIRETVPTGWVLAVSGENCSPIVVNNVTVGARVSPIPFTDTKCTFTNTKRATVTVNKTTVGGDGSFLIHGTFGERTITTTNGSGSTTFTNVAPGTYQLLETVPTGWTAGPWGGNCGSSGALTIQPGTTNITCTITNTRQATVSIDKVTVPSGDQQLFSFAASPGLNPPTFSLTDAAAPQAFANIAPNATYTFTETPVAGYTLATSGGDCTATANGVTVTPKPGQTVTCTFTNTKLGSIRVDKTANGGDATFGITESTLGNRTITTKGGTGTVTYANVPPGRYDLGESPLDGWVAGTFGGDCGADGIITIAAGQNATCSITNTKQATVTIKKVTAPASSLAFAFSASGGLQPPTFTLSNGQAQAFTVPPGQTRTFTETVPPGWRLTTGGDPACVVATSGVTVTPTAGQVVTCTFTNTQDGSIRINKTAVGGNGTFSLSAAGLAPVAVTTTNGTGTGTFANVAPGTYDIDEVVPAGWSAGPFTGDCAADGRITVTAGRATTCAITNTRLSTINIAKVTKPGGSSQRFDFAATGAAPATFQLGDGDTRSFTDLTPGQPYVFSEIVPTGWQLDATGAGCTYDANTHTVVVTPAAGTTITCTFTNTQHSTIEVHKATVGGDGTFTFDATSGGVLVDSIDVGTSNGTGSGSFTGLPLGRYDLDEAPLPGWEQGTWGGDCDADGVVSVSSGGSTITCTITNTKLPTVTVEKVTQPAGDTSRFPFTTTGGLTPSSFDLAGGEFHHFTDLEPGGTYTFTENLPPGWIVTGSGTGCTYNADTHTVSVTPTAGQDLTCRFTNTKLATITIDKVTGPAGDLTTFDFTATGGLSPTSFQLTDAAPPRVFTDVTPGQPYSILESPIQGSALAVTGAGCTPITNGASITPQPGDNIVCTFTNTRAAAITIAKSSVGGDGTFVITEPSQTSQVITTTGGSVTTPGTGSVVFVVRPGTYDFDETPQPGWVSGAFGGDCSVVGKITVTAGQAVTCTITNTKNATVNVTKVTDPLSSTDLFDFTSSDPSAPTFTLGNGGTQTLADLTPGQSVTIGEDVPPGWALVVTGAGCNQDPGTGDVTVTPTAGQVVNCTFTNTRFGSLTIDKTTSGGDDTFGFTEATLGPLSVTTTGGTGAGTYTDVLPGVYDLAETPLAGWSAGAFGGDCAENGTITITAGQDATCSITNTKLASVTVRKATAPTGDPATFAFTAAGGVIDTFTLGDGGAKTYDDLQPGLTTTFTETVPAGWSMTSVAGAGCTFDAATASVSVTPQPGGVTDCTITNTKLATINIAKVADPSTGAPFDFTAAGGTISPTSFQLSGGATQAFPNVAPNVAYTVTESVPAGWSLVTSGDPACVAATNGVTVTPEPGQTVTCTFTNTELGTITIDKTALGGDATFDFTEPLLGPLNVTTIDGSGGASYKNVAPGTYDLGEAPLAGWQAGAFGGNCAADGTVTISAGDDLTCTITNTALAQVTIAKVTDPAGSTQQFDFAAPNLIPAAFQLVDGGSQAFTDLVPGQDLQFTETVPAGWSLDVSGAGCAFDPATSTATVTPAPGDRLACTFTNTRLATVNLTKTTVGGDGTFTFTAAGLGPLDITTTSGTGAGAFTNVAPGTYVISEALPPGWVAGSFGGDCSATGTLTVAPGDSPTCTITNTKLATITIDKVTNPGGDVTQFPFTAGGGLSPSTFSLSDLNPPHVFSDVTPGQTYTITETVQPGWSLVTSGTGCSATTDGVTVTPTPGADITCTFTNTQSGSITIQKTSLGGDATFGITEPTLGNRNVTTTNGSGSVTYTGVAPGSYDFDESPLAGWVAGDFGGACAADGTVTFAAGQTLTCTLTNTRLGSITIQKSAVGGDATFGITEPTLGNQDVTTTNGSGSVTYTGVGPGSYDFDESPLPGWVAGDFGGACAADGTVTFAAGQTLTCTVTNTKLATTGTLRIETTTLGADGTFHYTVEGPATSTTPAVVASGGQITAAATVNTSITTVGGSGSMSMPNLASGNYSIRQLPEFGWANGQLTCPAPPGPTQPTGTAFVPPGGEVVCRVTNVKLASLVIQKVTSPAGTAGTFVFGANAGLSPASFSLADGQQQRIDNITPGQTVAVNELVPANWLLSTSGTGCTSTGFGVTVNLAPGQVLTCTFTNTVATPTIVITPPNVPPGGTVDIAIGGLPPGASIGIEIFDPAGRLVGTRVVTVGPDGRIDSSYTVPGNFPPGRYTVRVSGPGFAPFSKTFQVEQCSSCSTNAPAGFGVTGSGALDLGLLGLIVAGLGLGLVLVTRRRRT